MAAVKVVVFGYDQLLLTALEVLASAGAEIVAAVFPSVRQDARANEIREEVRGRGIETIEQPLKCDSNGFAERISSLEPDLIFVWSYPMILAKDIIGIPRLGCMNLHMGLLPHYRGVNGLKWALINDEAQTGVTLHYMDEGIDTGDMISRISFPLGEEDDLVSLMKKARFAGVHLINNVWPQIVAGTLEAIPQDEAEAAYYSAAMEPAAEIDWSWSARKIHNLIRATVFPFEGVHTIYGREKIVVRRSAPVEIDSMEEPGTVLSIGANGVEVAAGSGRILITAVEADANGNEAPPISTGIKVGDRLGSG